MKRLLGALPIATLIFAFSAQTSAQHFYAGRPDVSAIGDTMTNLTKTAYSVGYSETKRNPLWAAFYLESTTNTTAPPRSTYFTIDNDTTARVKHNDYTNSGFDRGHMAPRRRIGVRHGKAPQKETFTMSNIVPQLPTLNQEPWAAFEGIVSGEYAQDFDGVWVVTGPIFHPDRVIENCTDVEIPIGFYKIVVRENEGQPEMLGIVMGQMYTDVIRLRDLAYTVDIIELMTGIDFFSELSDEIEDAAESTIPEEGWNLDQFLMPPYNAASRDLCDLTVTDRE